MSLFRYLNLNRQYLNAYLRLLCLIILVWLPLWLGHYISTETFYGEAVTFILIYPAFVHALPKTGYSPHPVPPLNVEILFRCFIAKDDCEAIIGDVNERFRIILMVQGHRSAELWYWRQVIQLFFLLVFAAIRRVSGYEKLMGLYWRKRS
jgi:hypothetical protein